MNSALSLAAEKRCRQAEKLRERYDDGASVEDLERESGLSHGTVLNRLHNAGTVMRTPAQTRRLKASPRQDQARRALGIRLRNQYERGMDVKALAIQEGLSARTIRRRLAEAGATLRPGHQTRRLTGGTAAAKARRRLAADLRRRYEAGEGVPALAANFGTSPSTVYRLLHQAQTVMRPQHQHGPRSRRARPP